MSGNADDKITLKIHGLKVDRDLVRADVFVEKLQALMSALKGADRLEHGGTPRYEYIIADLAIGSALATLREKPKSRRKLPIASSVGRLSDAVGLINEGDLRRAADLPLPIIRGIQRMTGGASQSFSHAEIIFPHSKVIRVDDFLDERVKEVMALADQNRPLQTEYFHGIAFGSFEGVLQELDARGTILKGRLVLSAGGAELDCVMNSEDIPRIRENFNKRVSVEALAHYDGKQALPVRLEIRHIDELEEAPDLTKWCGKFELKAQDDLDEEW